MTTTIYGIRNCDTMKKARAWLESRGIAHDFLDYKVTGASREMLSRWCAALGWETVLNRAGTTFRALPEAEKAGLDEDGAVSLMLAQPSMIKRPILDRDGELIAGFKSDIYEKRLVE
jgi:Spx/MgsR family transcriptional regulator